MKMLRVTPILGVRVTLMILELAFLVIVDPMGISVANGTRTALRICRIAMIGAE
jgi:hypothetical protein